MCILNIEPTKKPSIQNGWYNKQQNCLILNEDHTIPIVLMINGKI